MKLISGISLTVWLTLVQAANSRDAGQRTDLQVDRPEEREIITREKLNEYMASKDSNTAGLMDLAKASFGGIGVVFTIDYSQSGGQIAWEVTQAIVPVIGAALALIPGVGVIVSGLFLGVWSLISPLFAPKNDNPMEKMINELAKKLDKRMDEKLTNLVNKAIYGEIARNNYICNKYTFISHYFADYFKASKTLKKSDATNLMLYLNDCDNFLKDTAEAFVYADYADVLWVPGAITTATRIAFLAEIIKTGHLLGMKRDVTVMYFQELKLDIQRQFEYHHKGFKRIHQKLVDGKQWYDNNKDYLQDISAVETAACSLQSQLFYFDRELYPYGMPTVLNNSDNFATIRMKDHFKPSNGNKFKHLQIFFNVTNTNFPGDLPAAKNLRPYRTLQFQNCFLGPLSLIVPNTYWFNFRLMPVKNTYSYEFRVIYLQPESSQGKYEGSVPILKKLHEGDDKFWTYEKVHKKIYKGREIGSRTCLLIEFKLTSILDSSESQKFIDILGLARWKTCPYIDEPLQNWRCNSYRNMLHTAFRMYSAGTFNHRSENLNPLIAIEEPTIPLDDIAWPMGFVVGVEIILRPLIH